MTLNQVIPAERFSTVLKQYNLEAKDFRIEPVGSGHIHLTFRLDGRKRFILQRVNKNVFRKPEVIASNIRIAAAYLHSRQPGYQFITPLPTAEGTQMAYDNEGFPWRIFQFFENTYTVDKVETSSQAFSAAAEFGRLGFYLREMDVSEFGFTIDRFHDLAWRYEQFETSLKTELKDRLEAAASAIRTATHYKFLVDKYRELIASGVLKLRITHNDTKINNVLFDQNTNKAVTAIDLDTLMPGYFIYDMGDMIRTFVSPVDEEERDLSKVAVRKDIYQAVVDGYLSWMKTELTEQEQRQIPFSGMMMTYIMALRMLADFLNGDTYYKTTYPGQNLVRANNQFRLLGLLEEFHGRHS